VTDLPLTSHKQPLKSIDAALQVSFPIVGPGCRARSLLSYGMSQTTSSCWLTLLLAIVLAAKVSGSKAQLTQQCVAAVKSLRDEGFEKAGGWQQGLCGRDRSYLKYAGNTTEVLQLRVQSD